MGALSCRLLPQPGRRRNERYDGPAQRSAEDAQKLIDEGYTLLVRHAERHDPRLAALYRRNAEAVGRRFEIPEALLERSAGSTDMGNVSQVLPAVHPVIGIESLPAVNHQPEFAAHCATPAADRAVFDGSLALAWTAIDAAADRTLAAALTAR